MDEWVTTPAPGRVAISSSRSARLVFYCIPASVALFLLLSGVFFHTVGWGPHDTGSPAMLDPFLIFGLAGVGVLTRTAALQEVTFDLERRTFEMRHCWPGPKTRETGSMDEFTSVYVSAKTQKVYLRRKQAGRDLVSIYIGRPDLRRMSTADYGAGIARLLGVPFLGDPRGVIMGSGRSALTVIPKKKQK